MTALKSLPDAELLVYGGRLPSALPNRCAQTNDARRDVQRGPSRAIKNARKPGVQASVTMLNRARKYIYEEPPRGQVRNTLEILQTLHVKRDAANHSIRVTEALETSEIELLCRPTR